MPPCPERRRVPGVVDPDHLAALRLMNVSRETEAMLALYVDLLRRWQTIKNLVGPSTLPNIWTRHIADSAQLLPLAPHALRWADLGTGAGFPGLVLAILLHARVGGLVHLIESNSRKCAFLREVIREVGCPAVVHDARVEAVIGALGDVDVVTSRALAPLPDLLAMGKSPMERGALGLFLKSATEIDAIEPAHRVGKWTIVPSRTSPDGRIVLISLGQSYTRLDADRHCHEDPHHD